MNEQGRHTPTPLPGPDVHVHDWAELALDYADGTLSTEASLAVEQHLAACEACRSVLAQHAAAAQALAAAPLAEPPAELHAAVFAALGLAGVVPGHVGPGHGSFWTRLQSQLQRPRVWLPAAAVLLLAVTLSGLPLVRQAAIDSPTFKSASPEVAADSGGAAGRQSASTGVEGATGAPSQSGVTTLSAPSTTVGMGSARSGTSGVAPAASDASEPSASLLTPYLVEARAPSDSHPAALLVSFSLGVSPVPSSLWLGGPTFAVFVPRVDLNALLARLERSGLALNAFGHRTAGPGSPVAALAHAWRSYPALVALDVGDPLGPVFVPQALGDAAGDMPPGSLALVIVTTSDQVR